MTLMTEPITLTMTVTTLVMIVMTVPIALTTPLMTAVTTVSTAWMTGSIVWMALMTICANPVMAGMAAFTRFITAVMMFWMTGSTEDTSCATSGATMDMIWPMTLATCVMTGVSWRIIDERVGRIVETMLPTVVMTCPMTGSRLWMADWMPGRMPASAPPSMAARLSSIVYRLGPACCTTCWICEPNCWNMVMTTPKGLASPITVCAMWPSPPRSPPLLANACSNVVLMLVTRATMPLNTVETVGPMAWNTELIFWPMPLNSPGMASATCFAVSRILNRKSMTGESSSTLKALRNAAVKLPAIIRSFNPRNPSRMRDITSRTLATASWKGAGSSDTRLSNRAGIAETTPLAIALRRGTMFFSAVPMLSASCWLRAPMSAFSLPNPANQFCHAAFIMPMDPSMVVAASLEVVPAISRLFCMTWIADTTFANDMEEPSTVTPSSFWISVILEASWIRRFISS